MQDSHACEPSTAGVVASIRSTNQGNASANAVEANCQEWNPTVLCTLQLMAMRAVPATVPPELRPVVEGAIVNFLAASVPFGGVRAVPVDTGKGTVLAAVFGTVKNGASTCFFFPTVGITEVK